MEADPGDGGTDDNHREQRRLLNMRSRLSTQSMEASPPDPTPFSRRPSRDIPSEFLPHVPRTATPPPGPPPAHGPASTPPRATLALRPLRPQHSSASGTLQGHTPTQQRLWLMEGSEGGGPPAATAAVRAAAGAGAGAPSDTQDPGWAVMEQGDSTTPRVVVRAVRSLQENVTAPGMMATEREAADAASNNISNNAARQLPFRAPSVVPFDGAPVHVLGSRAQGPPAAQGPSALEFATPTSRRGSGLGAAYGLGQQSSTRPFEMTSSDRPHLMSQQRQQQQQQQQMHQMHQMQRQGGALGQAVFQGQQTAMGIFGGAAVEDPQEYEEEDDAVISQTTVPIGNLPVETLDVTVAVRIGASSSRRPKSGSGRAADEDLKTGYVKGPVCGVFDLKRYLAETSCIKYKGEYVSRSAFEKEGKSKMAKWYRSIRALPDLATMEDWLKRHGLPVLKGPPRRSRKQAERKGGGLSRLRDPHLTASPKAESSSAGATLPAGISGFEPGRLLNTAADPLAAMGRPPQPLSTQMPPGSNDHNNNIPIRHPDPRFLQRLMNTLPASQHFMVPVPDSHPESGSSGLRRDVAGLGTSTAPRQLRLSDLPPRVSSCGEEAQGYHLGSVLHPPGGMVSHSAPHVMQSGLATVQQQGGVAAESARLNIPTGIPQTATPRGDETGAACWAPQGAEPLRTGARGGGYEAGDVGDSDTHRLPHPRRSPYESADQHLLLPRTHPALPSASQTLVNQLPPQWVPAAPTMEQQHQGPSSYRHRSGQVAARQSDHSQDGRAAEAGGMDSTPLPRLQSAASEALPVFLPPQPPSQPHHDPYSLQQQLPHMPLLQPLQPRRRRRRDELDPEDGPYMLPGSTNLEEPQKFGGSPAGWQGAYNSWQYQYSETQQQQQPQQQQQQQRQQLIGEAARQPPAERAEHQRVLRIKPLADTSPPGQGVGAAHGRIPTHPLQEGKPPAASLMLLRPNTLAGNSPDERGGPDGRQTGMDGGGYGQGSLGGDVGTAKQGLGQQGREHSRFRTPDPYMHSAMGAEGGCVELMGGANTDSPSHRRRWGPQFDK